MPHWQEEFKNTGSYVDRYTANWTLVNNKDSIRKADTVGATSAEKCH